MEFLVLGFRGINLPQFLTNIIDMMRIDNFSVNLLSFFEGAQRSAGWLPPVPCVPDISRKGEPKRAALRIGFSGAGGDRSSAKSVRV
jgi:hypothetical protein